MPLFPFSVLVSIGVGIFTLHWFFRDAEDSTRSLEELSNTISNPFSFQPWWTTKFGLWLALAVGAGMAFHHFVPELWARLLASF